MKAAFINIIRKAGFQFIWERLKHFSLVAMNYYGGSDLTQSGELGVLHNIGNQIKNVPQPVVFDVGANVGQFLSHSLTIFPENTLFYCFEPVHYSFEELKTVAVGHQNVVLLKLGIGDRCQKATIRLPTGTSAMASLHVFNDAEDIASEEIEITTIDIFCAQNNIGKIDFLKMDIEGHEVAALKGAAGMIAAGKISMIQFEFGQSNIASRTFLKDFYSALGSRYDIHRIVRNGLVPLGKYSEENEVFLTANYLAILKRE